MCEQIQNPDSGLPAAEHAKPGQQYWVQCKGYRCLAVLDNSGKWNCVATGKELTDVIRVYSD
jgi:hypothetical protein